MSQDGNGSLAAKIASLSTLQTIISRMSTISVSIKTIFITVFGFFISGYWLDGGFALWQKFIPFFFVALFLGLLDSYYLSIEKRYRHVYEMLSGEGINNDANFFNWKVHFKKFDCEALKSFSVWGFYTSVYLIYVLVVSVIYDTKSVSHTDLNHVTYTSNLLAVIESQEKTQKRILDYLDRRSPSHDCEYKIKNNITIDNERYLPANLPKKNIPKPIVKTCN